MLGEDEHHYAISSGAIPAGGGGVDVPLLGRGVQETNIMEDSFMSLAANQSASKVSFADKVVNEARISEILRNDEVMAGKFSPI